MKLFNILSFLTVGVVATVASASASTSDETGSQVFLRGADIIIASDINDDASSRRRLEDTAGSDSDTSSNGTTDASTDASDDDTADDDTADPSSNGTTDASTDTSDFEKCPVDKHGCYCCENEYDGGDLSCRTDHKGRYCCGAEDQCSEDAVHPTTDDTSTSVSEDDCTTIGTFYS